AIDRKHLVLEVDCPGEPVAAPDPAGDRLAQIIRTADPGIGPKQRFGLDQLVDHKARHRFLGIPRGHLDRRLVARLNAGEQARRPRKRREDGAVGERREAMEFSHEWSFPRLSFSLIFPGRGCCLWAGSWAWLMGPRSWAWHMGWPALAHGSLGGHHPSFLDVVRPLPE